MFTLHPRLAADTIELGRFGVSNLYLMNDSRYCWLILVPAIENLTELHELNEHDYKEVMQTVRSLSKFLKSEYSADKINVGALGNLVPQLHIHIIARKTTDEAWPGPVWGHGEAVKYDNKLLNERTTQLNKLVKLI